MVQNHLRISRETGYKKKLYAQTQQIVFVSTTDTSVFRIIKNVNEDRALSGIPLDFGKIWAKPGSNRVSLFKASRGFYKNFS